MDWRAEIRAAIRDAVRKELHDASVQATVASVNKDAGTIVAHGLKEDVDYHDVRLRAVLDDDSQRGILAYPKVGSQVSVTWLDGIDVMGFVSQYSAIDSFRLVVDNQMSLELTANGQLLLNGDALGGLVKVEELVKRLNKLEERMSSHQHLVGKAPTISDLATNPPIIPTEVADLENPNVKHG